MLLNCTRIAMRRSSGRFGWENLEFQEKSTTSGFHKGRRGICRAFPAIPIRSKSHFHPDPIAMFPIAKPMLALICGSTLLHAAKPPGEFLDIPWRAPGVKATEILSKRPDLKISVNTPKQIVGEGGSFADHPVDHIELEILDDEFVTGTAFLAIPPGNAPNGPLLRDIVFESLLKSLEKQYGKAPRSSDPNHTEVNWSWITTEALSSKKMEFKIQLFYSWEPYEFRVRYAIRPPADAAPGGAKSKDL
jgi:hypothetical protein